MTELIAEHLEGHGLTLQQYADTDHSGVRRCSGCGTVKPSTADFFHRNRAARGGGLAYECKPCRTAREKTRAAVKLQTEPGTIVTCKVCGDRMRRLAARHLAPHGLTLQQYIDKYDGGMQTCTSCGVLKPATEESFYRRASGRLHAECRECLKAASRVVSKRSYDREAKIKAAQNAALASVDGAVVECRICGKFFAQVTHTHLALHGVTVEEYAVRFPEDPVRSRAAIQRAVDGHGFDEGFRQKRRGIMEAFWASGSPEVEVQRAKLNALSPTALLRGREAQGIPTWRTTEIPEELCGAIVGMVLGDSGLAGRTHPGKHAHLTLGHCESQRQYLEAKVALLGSLVFKSKVSGPYRGKKPAEPFYKAATLAHPFFSSLHDFIYGPDGEKRYVTPEIMAMLDDRGLAYWYFDDGCFSDGSIKIATCSFMSATVDFMISCLEKQFGIQATKHKYPGGHFIIYVRRSSHERFFSLVAPYVQPCMSYKLPPGSP